MRRSFPILQIAGLVGAVAVCVLAREAEAIGTNTLVADLSGAQEVGPVTTAARGAGVFIIDRNDNTLTYHISFTGLSSAETMAHIHGPAPAGTNADIVHTLPLGNPKTGVWNYPESMENDILRGRMYVNIHSANFTSGEIRGQIGTHLAVMNSRQVVPPNGSAATGWGTFVVDTDANTLTYHIAYSGLSSPETSATIRGPNLHTQNAGLLHTLPPGNPKIGVYNYPEALEDFLLLGCLYTDIRTLTFPSGEIRGQLCNIIVPMDGSQEVPPNASPAAGMAQIAIDPPFALSFHIERFGLTSAETVAHIHGMAPPGMIAGPLLTLPNTNPKLGLWPYGAANNAGILAGQTYINIHTTNFPDGEIRGQILVGAKQPCPADLSDDGQVNAADLALLLGAWNTAGADLTGDGTTNAADLAILLGAWGECP